MEENIPSQYRSIPWGYGGPGSPFHGIGVDAERKRACLCFK